MKNSLLLIAATLTVAGCATSLRRPSGQPSSPYVADGNPQQTFPLSEAPVFQAQEPIALGLRAEFERVHKANQGGNWTGEERTDAIYWSSGLMVESLKVERLIPVRVRARGMSSASDQDFPKLRVEIAETEKLADTAFKGARNFRINTHVSTEPQTSHTGMGRLNDERAPYREAMGFEIARAMGLPTPAFRRARIAYDDAGSKKRFVREALLIETDKKTAERFGAEVLSAEEFLSSEGPSRIKTRLAANFFMFQALIGNDDTGLRFKNESTMATEFYRPLFNTTVFQLPSGEQFPLVYDLDMSQLMTNQKIAPNLAQTMPAMGVIDGEVGKKLLTLAKLRSRLSSDEFEQAYQDFITREPAIRDAIARAITDDEGRANASHQIEVLKKANLQLYQMPMIGKTGVRFFAEPALKTDLLRRLPASEEPGFLPPGYPIKVLENDGKIAKIAIADYSFYLKDFRKSVGYVKSSDLEQVTHDLPEELQGHTDERDMAGG